MYHSILVPVDLTDNGFCEKAVHAAIEQVKVSQGKIHLLKVIPDYHQSMVDSYFPEGALENLNQQAKTKLTDFANKELSGENIDYELHIIEGNITTEILNMSENLKADIIIMASHKKKGLEKIVLGSVANKVASRCNTPVLIVKPDNP